MSRYDAWLLEGPSGPNDDEPDDDEFDPDWPEADIPDPFDFEDDAQVDDERNRFLF